MTEKALTLTENEQSVFDVLDHHRGRGQAIGLDAVAAYTGLSEREVQSAVAELIEHHGRPIGSAVKKPMGYYLIETEEELAESLNQLTHRLTALARRIAALKQSTTPVVLQQLAIELTEEAA